MISLRYHVISIAAVFLALALGVVLGSAAISDRLLSGLSSDKASLSQEVGELHAQRAELADQLGYAQQLIETTGPAAVRGALDGRSVVLVTTADADPTDRDAVASLVRAAGAAVTGEVQLTEVFTNPARADQLRELTIRLLPAGVQLPTASDPGTLAGGLLGALLLVDPGSGQPQATPEEITAVFAGLENGGFARIGPDVGPAQLAVVLTGGTVTGDGSGDRAGIVARFASQLDRSGAGTVLAGRAGSAEEMGPVGVVRSDTAATSTLSTVDNVQTAAGRVVTVLALREQAEGRAGRYGSAANAEAVLPGAIG